MKVYQIEQYSNLY